MIKCLGRATLLQKVFAHRVPHRVVTKQINTCAQVCANQNFTSPHWRNCLLAVNLWTAQTLGTLRALRDRRDDIRKDGAEWSDGFALQTSSKIFEPVEISESKLTKCCQHWRLPRLRFCPSSPVTDGCSVALERRCGLGVAGAHLGRLSGRYQLWPKRSSAIVFYQLGPNQVWPNA